MSSSTSSGLKRENTSRPSLLSRLDASLGFTSGGAFLASNPTNSFNIKPEPNEPTIPQRRSSGSDLATTLHIKAEPFPLTTSFMPPVKKVKSEVPKTPLATLDRNNVALPPAARSQLEEIDRTLTQKRNEMYVFSGYRRRTKEDKAKFTRLSKEIDRLIMRRNVLITQVVATAPPAPASVPAAHPSPHPVAKLIQSGPGVSGGPDMNQRYTQMQPHPFSLPLMEDHKPTVVANPYSPPLGVASGSNVRLSDDPSEMDVDGEDHYIPPNVHFEHEIYNEDQSGYGENYDQDGNWMGRGRDRFVGPTAAKDE